MNRLKLLVVFSSLDVGGAEVQFSLLLSRLDRRLFDIQVAYFDARTGFPKETLEAAGIAVRFLGNPVWSRRRCLVDAFRFMRQERFDLVHCLQHATNFYGWLPAVLNRVPVIICGLQGKVEVDGKWSRLYALAAQRSSGWIVNSETLRDYAQEQIPALRSQPFRVVTNGVVDPGLRAPADVYEQLKRGRPVIGTVGRLHPVKNHLLFLHMAKALVEAGIDADFWIIGKGPMQQVLEEQIATYGLEDQVRLLGFRADVPSALQSMDLFVLTSDSESCPNVLLEAMQASLPVVSTRCTGLQEIIIEGHNGFTVALGDAQGLARQVAALLADPQRTRQMGSASRQLIAERFSMSAAVHKLQEAYLELAAGESRRSPRLATTLAALTETVARTGKETADVA